MLEEQLEESRTAHAELCAVGKQLAAAESTIHSISKRSETPDAEVQLGVRAVGALVGILEARRAGCGLRQVLHVELRGSLAAAMLPARLPQSGLISTPKVSNLPRSVRCRQAEHSKSSLVRRTEPCWGTSESHSVYMVLQSDLRRAISEKVAALDMLASAEKIMLEREAADGERGACPTRPAQWWS